MTTLQTVTAVAFVNQGRWLADCPRRHCNNAMTLELGQSLFHCGGPESCGQLAPVAWPNNANLITEVLAMRPVPRTRNWAPAGHRQALACGFPNGQSVAELIAETRENEEMV